MTPTPPVAKPEGKRGGTWIMVLAWVLFAVAVAAATTGFVMRQSTAKELSKTRATLATTQAHLKDVQGSLSAANSQVDGLTTENATLTDENSTLDGKVNACQQLFKTFVKLPPTAANVNRFWDQMIACYGSKPSWFR